MSIGASTGIVILSFFPSVHWFSEAFTLPFLIPFTRWESCPDFTASLIWFLNWRQSLVSCPWSSWKWKYLDMSRDRLLPNIRGGCSKRLAAFSMARISLGLLDRLESSPCLGPRWTEDLWRDARLSFSSLNHEQNQRYAALHVDPKSIKYHQCIWLQILIVENATCFLTVPPYVGGIFESLGGRLPPMLVEGGWPPCTEVKEDHKGLTPLAFLPLLLLSMSGVSLNPITLSRCLRTIGDLGRRVGVASLLGSGTVYHNLYLGGKALAEKENVGFDLARPLP
ncbi:hypothetical protein Tco_0191338 [Tanacetum coccineum]